MLASPAYVYLGIFIAKLIEVALATLRTVLNNRGQKILAAFIGFFEVGIWLFVASTVLKDVTSDFFKVFVYCLAFSFGNYLGVTLEEKIALGMAVVEIVVTEDQAIELSKILREAGYGVTTIDSNGRVSKMKIIKTYLKRKQLNHACNLIKTNLPNAIFSVSEIKSLTGGYIKK